MASAGIVLAISAAVNATSDIISTEQRQQAAEARIEELKQEQTQSALLATQQQLSRGQEIQRVVATQSVQAAARGVDPTSPSFTALEINSLQNFGSATRIAASQEALRQAALQSQIDQTKSLANASLFQGILSAGLNIFSAGSELGKAFGGGSAAVPGGSQNAFGAQATNSLGDISDSSVTNNLINRAQNPQNFNDMLLRQQFAQFPEFEDLNNGN